MTDRPRRSRAAPPTAGRRARRAAARAPQPPARRWLTFRNLVVAAAAIGVAGFIGLGLVSQATAKLYTCDTIMPAPVAEVPAEGVEMPDRSNAHVLRGTEIEYAECPPSSGTHYQQPGGPIRPGFYGPGSRADPGGWVHNLEHGYIVVLYRGEPAAADLDALRRFVDLAPVTDTATRCGYRAKIVVARFDDMSTPYAVLAWRRLLQLPAWDEAKALAFAQQWVEVNGLENGSC